MKRLEYDFVKNEFAKRNYHLLEREYKNANTKLEYICLKHEDKGSQFITYGNLHAGNDCRFCKRDKLSEMYRLSFDYVKSCFEECGYILLEESYINAQQKLKYLCPNHLDKVQAISFNNFRAGKRCFYCFGTPKKELEEVKKIFEKKGLTLLDDVYVNSSTPMNFICNKHPDKIQRINLDRVQVEYGCKECSIDAIKEKNRLPEEVVKSRLEDKGYIYVGGYINANTNLQYICPNHPHIIQNAHLHNILKDSCCKYCGEEKFSMQTSGESHWNWKGGKSPLSLYLRNEILWWRIESLKNYDYKCVITGKRAETVHHLYPFSKIVDETLKIGKLNMRESYHDYSREELEIATKICNDLHIKYGLGIPLTNVIHNDFHRIYSTTNFTPDDFQEYKIQMLNKSLVNQI